MLDLIRSAFSRRQPTQARDDAEAHMTAARVYAAERDTVHAEAERQPPYSRYKALLLLRAFTMDAKRAAAWARAGGDHDAAAEHERESDAYAAARVDLTDRLRALEDTDAPA